MSKGTKLQAQVRTQTYSGAWSQWVDVGEPMTAGQAFEWECLQRKLATSVVECRVIEVGEAPISVLALIKGVFTKR